MEAWELAFEIYRSDGYELGKMKEINNDLILHGFHHFKWGLYVGVKEWIM